MPLTELRVQNFRAFADSGILTCGPTCTIVGRNDVGKSGLLHALRVFFDPPKKGLPPTDFHGGQATTPASIEVAFDPTRLSSRLVQIDAKNTTDLVDDNLVDGKGLLRLRLTISAKGVDKLELLVKDTDVGGNFPLGLMDHDALLTALNAAGLPAVKAGKQTNQQKRDQLRQDARSKGATDKEEWVNASDHDKALRAVLPTFVFFADDANYALDETGVQNQFKTIVDKALSSHAAAASIATAITSTVQSEFDKIHTRLARLTDTITGVKADASVNWKKAVDGIGLEWTDRSGVALPFRCRGAGVRRLFMVAYFQYEAAASMHDPKGPKYVFAIEEPEVHLHPGAQAILNEAFGDLAAQGHGVAFTTHSPVFASCAPAESLILVKRGIAKSSACEQLPSLNLATVADELGVEASHRLVGKNHVVLVEGRDDVEILVAFLTKLNAAGKTRLKPSDVLFLQCGGIGNLAFVANSRCMNDAGLAWAVVMDSDRPARGSAPKKGPATTLPASPPSGCAFIHVLDRTYIENYLDSTHASTASGVACLIPEYGMATDPSGAVLPKDQWGKVKANGPSAAAAMTVAEIQQAAKRPTGVCEMTWLFNELANRFGL
jgi:putative ATP-dependent endonuclease of OLD family